MENNKQEEQKQSFMDKMWDTLYKNFSMMAYYCRSKIKTFK
jgi:hypothetical protein